MANVAVLNYVFATSDRKDDHFVWDLDSKTLFSIDHEIPTGNDAEPIEYFKSALRRIFGDNWFNDAVLRAQFMETFTSVWNIVDRVKATILDKYQLYGLQAYGSKFLQRLANGAQWALQRIMS